MAEKNATVIFGAAGLGLALLALYAASRGSSGSTTTTGGGSNPTTANALLQEAAAYNADAAQVSIAKIAGDVSIKTNANNDYATVEQSIVAGENALALGAQGVENNYITTSGQVEQTALNDTTQRIISSGQDAAAEYAANQNTLTQEAAATAQQSLAALESATEEALANTQASEAEKVAQTQAQGEEQTAKNLQTPWYDALLGGVGGALGSLFSGGGGLLGGAGSGTSTVTYPETSTSPFTVIGDLSLTGTQVPGVTESTDFPGMSQSVDSAGVYA